MLKCIEAELLEEDLQRQQQQRQQQQQQQRPQLSGGGSGHGRGRSSHGRVDRRGGSNSHDGGVGCRGILREGSGGDETHLDGSSMGCAGESLLLDSNVAGPSSQELAELLAAKVMDEQVRQTGRCAGMFGIQLQIWLHTRLVK